MSVKNTTVKKPLKKGIAKVPMVMQMEALECGAACLTMVLAYYSKWIPLEQVRLDCGVSRDGSNARNILRASRNYKLSAIGYRMEPEQLRQNGVFPCILHWNFNHFVVCNGFRGNQVYLNDPARGNVVVSMEEFDDAFTGICLMFEPEKDFVPSGKKKSIFSFSKKRLKGAGTSIVFVVLTMVISSLMGIIYPVFSRVFMDRLLTGKNPEWTYPFLVGLCIMGAIQVLVEWLEAIYALKINGKLAVYGSTSYLWKVLWMPMEFFSQRMVGDIQYRKQSNALLAKRIVDIIAPLLIDTVMMVFYFVVMLRYSILLTMVGLSSILIHILVSDYISKKRVNSIRVQMRDTGKLAGATVSGIEMIETLKSSGAEDGFFERWSGYQASANTQQVHFEKINQYLGLIPPLVSEITSVLVLGLGVYMVMQGSFTVGMVMAFQGFLASFSAPAKNLLSARGVLQEMSADMERIEDVMAYSTEDEVLFRKEGEEKEFQKLSGNLSMKHVTFGYSKLEEPLIEDFNLELKTGQRVALVGASGCGKSTISKLISGLYKPWSGEILLDGKPFSEIERSVFTGSLAVVDQDIILFEDTIAENIRMWDKSIEDFEIIMAARDAKLHEDIMEREGGYAYKMMEGGKDFSGGQRQRIEIARVLAQDPTIIIMDEATSALDAKTEYEVVKAIKDRGITCIVVAHRLSTIRDCDEIIVLDKGKIVERGTHQELFEKGGYYAKLIANE